MLKYYVLTININNKERERKKKNVIELKMNK